jgi:hypothetical protein
VHRHGSQDSVESSNAQDRVVGHRDPVMRGGVGFEDDVAADLVCTRR